MSPSAVDDLTAVIAPNFPPKEYCIKIKWGLQPRPTVVRASLTSFIREHSLTLLQWILTTQRTVVQGLVYYPSLPSFVAMCWINSMAAYTFLKSLKSSLLLYLQVLYTVSEIALLPGRAALSGSSSSCSFSRHLSRCRVLLFLLRVTTLRKIIKVSRWLWNLRFSLLGW